MEVYLELDEDNVVIAEHDTDTDAIELIAYNKTNDIDPIGMLYEEGGLSIKPPTLAEAKTQKLDEIKTAKKLYQNRDVISQINGEDYHFFGGLESARKYKDAMDLAIALGMTKGTVKVREGLIAINESDMKIALNALSLQVYRGWLKESHYIDAINAVVIDEDTDLEQAMEELELIVWEDERSHS